MNYSVFKVQNQAGKPGIFWEKETIPKNDRKKKDQRFPIRRYPGDKHHVESDLVSLTPDEPPPPPKPAKNFIQRNRKKVTNKKEPPSTVTLTQEQLNAILKSVGKVAGGSENAVKISIDKNNETKEITVESPRRYDRGDDDDYDDRKERRRKKKPVHNDEEGSSIYSLLGGDKKTKAASSDTDSGVSDASIELRRVTRHRKERKPVEDDLEDEIQNYLRDKNKRNNKRDIDNEDNIRDKKSSRSKSKKQTDLENEIEGIRRNKARLSELEHEIEELRRRKQGDDDNDSDYEKENRVRRGRSKRQEVDTEEDSREYERSRTRKSTKTRKEDYSRSRERRGRKTRKDSEEREENLRNDSLNKEEDELIPSPRDKIGLPIDLSWRHMTKAERRRLEMARQKVNDDEDRKEEERIKDLNSRYAPVEETRKISPQRHRPPRSDPVTRVERGRETEISHYTDNHRKGRRSRSPSEHRTPERSPDLPSYTTPDTSPKAPLGVPLRHMTLAEKKRLEWERERVESVQLDQVGKFDPWGRPGAGAPLRTRSGHVMADYKGRQVRKASYAGKVMMMY